MQRDEYLQFKADQEVFNARAELAKAFMSKLEQTKIEDANILAAINDWMETGDNSFFEEYCTFRFKKTEQEREAELKELREQIEIAQEEKEELQKDLDELRAYNREYQEYFDKIQEWRYNMAKKVDEDASHTRERISVRLLMEFLEEEFSGNKQWDARGMYICNGKKLASIKYVEITEHGQILLSTTDDGILLADRPEPPERKRMRSAELLTAPYNRFHKRGTTGDF